MTSTQRTRGEVESPTGNDNGGRWDLRHRTINVELCGGNASNIVGLTLAVAGTTVVQGTLGGPCESTLAQHHPSTAH